jgi:hypothetical protein
VTHSSSWWGSLTSNETYDWKVSLVVGRKPFSSLLFGLSTDFSNHNYTLSLWVSDEAAQDIDEVSSVEWISSNSDDGGLSKVVSTSLVDGLVGQSSGSGDNSNFTLLMDVTWHDTNLAFTWLNNSWAVWPNKSSLALRVQNRFNLNHVEGWDSFCDADDEIDLSFYGFENGLSSEWGWDVDDGSLGSSGSLSLDNRSENWESEMLGSSLSLVDSSNNVGSVFEGCLSMEGSLYVKM